LGVDLGTEQTVDYLRLYMYDDHGGVWPPAGYQAEYWDGNVWTAVSGQVINSQTVDGQLLTTIGFQQVITTQVRVTFTNSAPDQYSGLTEMEVYGGVLVPTPTPTMTPTPACGASTAALRPNGASALDDGTGTPIA